MEEKSKIGRPTKYKEEYDKQAYKLCLLGFTDVDLASFFEVEESTINNWKNQHPSFLESIKNGKTVADADVSLSLNKRANGYDYIETKKTINADGTETITTTTKHVSPDVGAQAFWLKNRQPKIWRNKQEQDININGAVPVTGMEVVKPKNED